MRRTAMTVLHSSYAWILIATSAPVTYAAFGEGASLGNPPHFSGNPMRRRPSIAVLSSSA
jgi:hypothetical protein